MGEIKNRQIKGFVHKQKRIISSAKTEIEKAEAFGLWAGFINGLRITGAITHEEYETLFEELESFKHAA